MLIPAFELLPVGSVRRVTVPASKMTGRTVWHQGAYQHVFRGETEEMCVCFVRVCRVEGKDLTSSLNKDIE